MCTRHNSGKRHHRSRRNECDHNIDWTFARASNVLFVTRLENFKMDVLFVTFDRRFKVESRRIWRRYRRRQHSLLAGPCWPRSSFANLIPATVGGKRKKGEREGAWSTVYRYHVSLSLSLSLLPRFDIVPRSHVQIRWKPTSLSETRALTNTPSTDLLPFVFQTFTARSAVRGYQMCLPRDSLEFEVSRACARTCVRGWSKKKGCSHGL